MTDPSTPGTPGVPEEAGDLAARVWREMRAMVLDLHDRRRQVCAALGMSFIRAKALRRLAAGPATLRRLAADLATDAPYTTVIVEDLVRRGLVVREVDPGDRRQRIVTITEAGARAAALADAILSEPPAPLRALDPADLATLHRVLRTLTGPHGPGGVAGPDGSDDRDGADVPRDSDGPPTPLSGRGG
ncbi:hypothetical protein Skr01_24460 [Sphaerisporangium krabiense]|uniref:DNA-binding MarR family transcriptional regulator n=1 Tax=Sphaerisporangium krabiense TaxID=763782 RepID=A0A7W9DR62_9ACTN|nr:MarR family winged helix-turn-helix transcriptional regulator [Sphaerisporangium krabiense]MBB5628191.1 DNA-binding MarR family transcriptional regulator [Sphaerisporangium krabiense]GII62361.1 hypothetical protein Skr01_24460 [Sphaerisporangium krabiense]